MTWWGALGLALSLYGVVVFLEWTYGQLARSPRIAIPTVSVVVRVTDQETHVEQAVRDLISLWNDGEWQHSAIELVIADGGSSDQTPAILERLSRDYPFLVVLDAPLTGDQVLAKCRHPVVVWVELSKAVRRREMIATVHALLAAGRTPGTSRPVA
ncbi:MAG: hypothetical protein M0Z53_04330 [Thermaerobacter sp.]|nr:hypothetical protein [Thermaerobacter sp.]